MSNTYTNSITLARLSDGTNGQPGTGITGRTVQYYVNQDDSINPATIPSSSWGGNFPTVTQGDCLWTKTTINYTSGEPSIIYSVSRIGEDGTPGTPGAPGAPGVTIDTVQYGTSNDANTNPTNWGTTAPANLTKGTWLWVKTVYSNNTEAITKSYIGTDGTSVYIQSATKVGDVTTVIIADSEGHTNTLTIQDGTDGSNGTNGTNGLNGYVHTAWANSANGETDFSTSVSTGKLYLGVYTDNTQADSQTPSDYSWSLIKGADGTSVTISQIQYGTSSSASTEPSTWQPTAPTSVSKGLWLWVKTTYNDNSTAVTKSYIGTDGQDGQDGTSVYIQSASKAGDTTTVVIADSEGHTNTLTIQDGADGQNGTNGTNGLSGYVHTAWANSADGSTDFSTTISQGKLYLGVYTDNTQADSSDYEDYSWTLIKGADGINGTNGINNATVYLYQRATSAPTRPNSNLTYTFATKTISGSALGNWQQTIPTGTNPVWLTIATANSSDSTDTIGSSEWTTPIRLDGQDGAPGVGIDGYNQATLYLYKRDSSTPTAPTATVTYTFSNGSFTAPTGWSKQIPSGSDPCYVTTAAAISRDSTVQVSNWSTPAKLVEDGASITVTNTTYEYVLSTDGTNPPSSGWGSSPVAPTTTQYSWTKTTVTYSDGSTTTTYTVGGKSGTNGNRGTTWYSGTSITGTSTTPAIFSGSGVSSAIVGDHYLNTSTQNVYVCTTAGAASVAKWKYEQNIKGATGAQFTGITNHYLVTSYSSGVTTSDSPSTYGSWTTTLDEEISSSKPYLWAYEDIKIDGVVASSTDPRIIGRYGTDGQNGTNGTNGTPGRGITGIAEWYQISNNNSTPPYTPTAAGTNYSNSPISPTKAKPYLWNYEVISYTTGNPDITTPKVVSNYSESNYFHVKYSNDGGQTFTANSGETPGAYIGTYVDTTEADSNSVSSYNWSKIEGVQIASVEYKVGNSSTQEPSGNWSSDLPPVSGGQYLWTKTTYTDGNIQYSVAKQGVSVTGTIGYYLATSASSGVTASQVTATTMQQMTSTNKYLWYCEANTFDDGTTGSKSDPVIIGVYGETGLTGKGISEVKELYYCSNSTSVPTKPTSVISTNSATQYNKWNLTCPTWTSTYKYYYTCSQIKYTDNTYYWTDPVANKGFEIANSNAAAAVSTANAANTLVNTLSTSKITTFYSSSTPTATTTGDLWIDTGNNNALKRWNGSSWQAVDNSKIQEALEAAADAQSTADGKVQTFAQTSQPTASEVGDLWIDTDDDNKLYRWSGSSWVSLRDATIAAAAALANTAQETADSKITTFYTNSTPSSARSGDLWIDTGNNNTLKRYNGSSWVAVDNTNIQTALTNAATAQSTADSKIITFAQNAQPTATDVGDLWIDTDDDNKLYRWNGTSWVNLRDGTIAAANTLASEAKSLAQSKIMTYVGANAPTGTKATGDLWIETDNNNKLYRWSGSSWVDLDNPLIAQALSDAADAAAIADGKITTYAQTSAPTGLTSTDVGDLWIDTDDNNRLYRWSGSQWVDVQTEIEVGGRNLYIRRTSVIGSMNSSGVVGTTHTSGERTSGYISIEAGETYCLQGWYDISNPTSSSGWICLSWFTSSMVHISQVAQSSFSDHYEHTFVAPTNAAYARISAKWQDIDKWYETVKFEKGNVATGWTVAPEDTVVSADVYYYASTSPTSLSGGSWNTTAPQWTNGVYIWSKTVWTHPGGDVSESTPVCITGNTGRDGDAIQYEPGFSNAKILKFYDEDGSTVYNVSSIQFWLNKIENGTATRMALSQYKVELGFYGNYNGTAVVSENFFTSLSGVSGQYEDGAGNIITSSNLQTVARTTNTTNNLINLNFENLFRYNSTNTNFINVSNAFKNSSGFFYVRFYSSGASGTYPTGSNYLIAQTVINFDFGTSNDMARFAVTANKIQAAVDQSALTFSAEGLKITNGGFKIVKSENNTETPLLEYSEAQGQLNIVGGGTFTGVIEATDGIFRGEVYASSGNFTGTINAIDGSFNGEITAQSGSIGGFEILEGRLVSTNSIVDDNPNDEITPNPTLIINGTTGEIIGGSIHLTSKAIIDDYIVVGAAAIFNPSLYDHTFISTENNTITIKDTGLMTLGNITLDGVNSTIIGNNFSITPQNSIFNNIVATGKIVTSVFETNKVQSVGGTMLFKPSYKVKEIESGGGIILDTEETLNINLGDKLLLVDKDGSALPNYFTVLQVDGTLKKVVVDEPLTINELNSIVVLGQENALIMGVNSGESTSLLKARGFTISEFVERNNEFTTDLKVFLGDLSSLSTVGLNGYGLYSDNVFLNGSLTTVFSNGSTSKYAGVNTLSQASATIINNDNSRIIFWAGSNDTSQESIQNAPFQVTSNGSIYASQGIFTGSVISDTIISNSEIYGSTIYGAKIVGWNNGQAGGLELWNTNNGISFMRDEYTQVSISSFASGVQYYTIENGVYTPATTYQSGKTYYTRAEETTLQVVQDGILFPILTSTDNKYVIRINNNQVYLKGNALETPYISILNGKLQSTLDSNYWISIHSPTTDVITLNTNNNKATFSQGEVIFEQLSFSCAGNVTYGEKFSYKRVISNNVTIGYDLYIGG